MMQNEMTLELAQNLYDDFILGAKPEKEKKRTIGYCEECETPSLTNEGGMNVCTLCGLVDSFETVVEYSTDYIPKKSLYKRRLYCMDKLRHINCLKAPRRTQKHNEIINKISSEYEFDSIIELKQILKELGAKTLYKYLYFVYYDIKKTKAIDISLRNMNVIVDQFVQIDSKFKCSDLHKRRNIVSYHSLIFYIMKKNNIDGYDNIILPYNNVKIMRLIRDIDK